MSKAYRLAQASDPVAVVPVGLACCSVELAATIQSGALVPLEDDADALGHVLLVAGTVTTVMAASMQATWEQLPEPKAVVAFGACASSGGPYWDAPTVRPGAASDLPVDRYVLGCPPRPADLVTAIREVGAAWAR